MKILAIAFISVPLVTERAHLAMCANPSRLTSQPGPQEQAAR